ncbi:putative sta22 protein [Orientia chuto str. Dubai]|uniref:Putative sta22 protein n=1 Tax=Orientia chuto str. Dubai TaxID=1359168 RepID=A0A0F3MKJ3_9RICK|nr:major outer membrane protein TSA22 [Candidatus Orientia mediorientalis]KJV56260.1 putative sta22 protein [Orientia chuto str. Dubai]
MGKDSLTDLKESMDRAVESASKNSALTSEQKVGFEQESKELQAQLGEMSKQTEEEKESTLQKLKRWAMKAKDFLMSDEFSELISKMVNFVQTALKESTAIVQAFQSMKDTGLAGAMHSMQAVTHGVKDISSSLKDMVQAGEKVQKVHFSSPEDRIKAALGAEGIAQLQAASAGLQSSASLSSSSVSSTPAVSPSSAKDTSVSR